MTAQEFVWTARAEFRDRTEELARLERWWRSSDREPLNLYGRRRVGKSWLFRRLAHGKPAVILVADRVALGQQLDRFAAQLEEPLGLRPQLVDVAGLVRVLYRLSATRKTLVVIDEFPYLLGSTRAEQQRTLSAVQAVLEEERDDSDIKLILTGSTIATMEELQAGRSPLHGRLVPLHLKPLRFAEARTLMHDEGVIDQLTRYSVTGGMPRYLTLLSDTNLASTIATHVVGPMSPLFDEPRTLLQTELREPAVYFSILASLARAPRRANEIAAELRMATNELSGYLSTLQMLQLVSRHQPVGAKPTARSGQFRCTDDFIRFWFRFVQPYQSELESGADPVAHVRSAIMPVLADHTAPTFERAVQEWMRVRYAGRVLRTGAWWGAALHPLRATRERDTEEIDAVGLDQNSVVAVAEAKWTNKPMGASVLRDLLDYKLPALAQATLDVDRPDVILTSRGGFSPQLVELAEATPGAQLVAAADLLTDLGTPEAV